MMETPSSPSKPSYGSGGSSKGWHNFDEEHVKLTVTVSTVVLMIMLVGTAVGLAARSTGGAVGFSGPVLVGGVARTLLWNDEFEGRQLNAGMWTPHKGNGCDDKTQDGQKTRNCGFGKGQLQSYAVKNTYVEGGQLTLEARREKRALRDGAVITSGKITSSKRFSVKYGRVEARITLPLGTGGWPTFTLVPAADVYGAYPASGQVDILETYNVHPRPAPTRVKSSLHYGEPLNRDGPTGQNGCTLLDGNSLSGEPHVYAVEWAPHSMRFYVDDYKYCEVTQWWGGKGATSKNKAHNDIGVAPFDQDFNIELALAVGGHVPQVFFPADIPRTSLPMKYLIDYVRVYDMTPGEMTWLKNPFPGAVAGRHDSAKGMYKPEPESGPYHHDLATGQQAPFQLSMGLVRIENEFFDYGGQGKAWSDQDPDTNSGSSPLRPHEGVDVYEESIYWPPGSGKLAEPGGGYVKYMTGEWTAYTVMVPWVYEGLFITLRHSTLMTNSHFKIVADSTDCTNPQAEGGLVVLDASKITRSHAPVQGAPAELGLVDVSPCWQSQVFEANVLPKGQHTLVFCSFSDDLNVSYFELTPFKPSTLLVEGPGCA